MTFAKPWSSGSPGPWPTGRGAPFLGGALRDAGRAEATEHLQMDTTRSTECTEPPAPGVPGVAPGRTLLARPERTAARAWKGTFMSAAVSVVRLSTTPIKGLSLDHPSSIELTTHGAVGDRQFFLTDEEGRIQSCTANADLLPMAGRFDQDSRRLEVVRGDEVLCAGIVDSAGTVDTDMWGLRTIVADVVAGPPWRPLFSDLPRTRGRLVPAPQSPYALSPPPTPGTRS